MDGYFFWEIYRLGVNESLCGMEKGEKSVREVCLKQIAKHEAFLDKFIIPKGIDDGN